MPKRPKPLKFRDPEQPDELFGHPCKVKFFDDSKILEATFNKIKVSDVPFKESDLSLTTEKSIFSYNNKNWIIVSVEPSGTLYIGNQQHYFTYKIIARDKNIYLRDVQLKV